MSKKQTQQKTEQKKKARGTASGFPIYCKYDEILNIEKVKPNPKNPNKHPDRQIDLLTRIIRGQGWRAAITISKRSGFIVRGHGRLLAARILNATEVPVEYQEYASEAEELADMIADNKLAELAYIDKKILKGIVGEIKDAAFDVSLTGIDSEELMKLLTKDDGIHSPEPEAKKKTITKRGDVWELGKNRLLCGDSTKPADMLKLMDGKKAHLLFTDPPYGVNYGENSKQLNRNLGGNRKGTKLKGDALADNKLINELLLPAFKQAFIHCRDDAAFFIWHADMTRPAFDWAINAAGLEKKQVIIWIKPAFVLGRADYHWKHEPCIYAQKCGKRARYVGNRDQATVWEIQAGGKHKGDFSISNGLRISQDSGQEIYIKKEPPKNVKSRMIRIKPGEAVGLTYDDSNTDTWTVTTDNKAAYIHPTQKPVELAARAIKNHTYPGDAVLDIFSGSGSTLIAAEKSERISYSMELDERFCDGAVQRYADYCIEAKKPFTIKLNGRDITSAYTGKGKGQDTGKGKGQDTGKGKGQDTGKGKGAANAI